MFDPEAPWQPMHVIVDEVLISSGYLYEIQDPMFWAIDTSDLESYRSTGQQFSLPQRLMAAARQYEAEVNNGGHSQFFVNSAGLAWQDALAWWQLIDFVPCSEILEEAIRRIGTEPSFDRTARWAQLDASAAEFHDLDSKFYEVAAARDAASLAYARLHPVEFLFDGMITKPDFGS